MHGLLGAGQVDELRAARDQANARVATARAALDAAQLRRDFAELRAPADGVISKRLIQPGQVVSAGSELLRLIRDGRLELDAQVPETELPLVRAGQSATVTSSEAGQTTGSVRIVTPEVNAQTRLGLARISLAPGAQLRPGMFARAEIDAGRNETTPLSGVIEGWRTGLKGQTVGSRVELVIPPAQSYPEGNQPGPPVVEKGDTLVYVVDILGIDPPAAATTQ